jgi:hypothetical protein
MKNKFHFNNREKMCTYIMINVGKHRRGIKFAISKNFIIKSIYSINI